MLPGNKEQNIRHYLSHCVVFNLGEETIHMKSYIPGSKYSLLKE